MTYEEIIKLARKAGIAKHGLGWTCWEGQLERFAALVAAEKEKRIIDILERLQQRNDSHNYYAYAINVIKGEI